MNEEDSKMNCAAFQVQLPELIESGESIAAHPHLRNCELCRALLADLETIAEAARQLFPIVEPPEELWEQIESKIRNEPQADKTEGSSGTLREPV
jgi:predicted anti-sigma-YlaC factor YlaD